MFDINTRLTKTSNYILLFWFYVRSVPFIYGTGTIGWKNSALDRTSILFIKFQLYCGRFEALQNWGNKANVGFERKERTCFTATTHDYFLPNQLLLSIFIEKTTMFCCDYFPLECVSSISTMFHLGRKQSFHDWSIGLKWIEAL